MADGYGGAQLSAASADSVVLLDVLRGVLDRGGGQRWLVRPDDAWCTVNPPTTVLRAHGWKLHVSATPLSAPLVLARAAEILVRHGCPFKFATDIPRVIQLVGPQQDRGAGGKFITAYPRDDEHIRGVAEELDRVTAGLAGPRILSDRQLRPGSLVHYRYGEFAAGSVVFTDEGLFDSQMIGPDGSAVRDERHPWFSPPPWAVSPFPEPAVAGTVPSGPMVLAGRFRITGAIRHANRGGVYQAVDEQDGRTVVVKQARAHVGAALDGTDVRDRLRHEARMLEILGPLSLFPAFVALLEEQGDLFLVEAEIPGTSLDRWAFGSDGRKELCTDNVIRIAGDLVKAVRSVHEAGLVLCDLKPSNIIVTPGEEVRLLDPEVVVEQGAERVRGYTPGFAAPELSSDSSTRPAPQTSADCFSLGVTLFCLASGGLEPHWVAGGAQARSTAERRRLLARIAIDRPALLALSELIVGLTEPDPDARWSLDRAEKYLTSPPQVHAVDGPSAGVAIPGDALDRLLADGAQHIWQGMTPHGTNLWPANPTRFRHDPCDAWRGAAGVLATLTRTAGQVDDPSLRTVVAQTAGWIDERLFDIPRVLPGLCFGRAGTAWALYEAGRLLGDSRLTARATELAGQLPTRGPISDVAYGLSGAGLARVYLWQATADTALLRGALDCAESVLAATRRSGADWLWPVPIAGAGGGPHLGQHSSYGFAHGVAGVGTFLLAAAQAAIARPPSVATGQADRFMRAAVGAGDTLLRGVDLKGGEAAWPTTTGGGDVLRGVNQLQWCNGPAGIGTFLIRLWAVTGRQRFADVAVQCAPAARDDWDVSLGSCCGLAGSGHFLLDLAEFTSDGGWRTRAERMASVIHAQARTVDGLRTTCPPHSGYAYGEGTAGVLDFLHRLHHGGPRPWLPAIHHATGGRLPLADTSGASGDPHQERTEGGETP